MSNAKAAEREANSLAPVSAGEYSIVELPRGEESRWDEFVCESQNGTFYHLAGWRSIIENQLHHPTFYLTCVRDGELQAVLPLAHVKSLLFGNALVSVPFLVYGGPISSNADAEQRIVARACELARELRVDYLELKNQHPQQTLDDDPKWHSSNSHVTFRKRIDLDPAVNLAAIPRKQRAMIRKGESAGLSFDIDDDAGRLYRSMLECKRNLGTPFFGRKYLQAIKDEFGDRAEILTVVHGKKTVCSVLSFYYKNQILPYYGGGGDLARHVKGNDFMYWCVMERACKAGVEIFDFGRSMKDSGAYRFKKHWGFEPEPLAYRHFLVQAQQVPDLNPANPKYRLAIAMWKRLPLPVVATIGPPLARRLG